MPRVKTKRKQHRKSFTRYLPYGAMVILLVGSFLLVRLFISIDSSSDDDSSSQSNGETRQEPDAARPAFNKSQYPVSDPSSPWVVVNKGRQLSSKYVPGDLIVPGVPLRYSSGAEMRLRQQAGDSLEQMFKAASSSGLKLMIASGYRSYGLQSSVYDRHVSQLGRSEADKVSARPGHSEHQSGWGVDVAPVSGKCMIETCFGELAEGQWVKANAHLYGFVVRYQQGKAQLTGYSYEPWHIRYVGVDLAGELYRSGQTLEQFFGLPPHPSYPVNVIKLE